MKFLLLIIGLLFFISCSKPLYYCAYEGRVLSDNWSMDVTVYCLEPVNMPNDIEVTSTFEQLHTGIYTGTLQYKNKIVKAIFDVKSSGNIPDKFDWIANKIK